MFLLTMVIELCKKKYRKSVVTSDNDWHDKGTDSLINFETEKHSTSKKWKIERNSCDFP